MNRAEAFDYLTLASDQIGYEWSKQRVSWIPNEVAQDIEHAVEVVLKSIDFTHEEWDEVNYQYGWRRGRSQDEIQELLLEFTRNAARDRRNQVSVTVTPERLRRRVKLESALRRRLVRSMQRHVEVRAERERVEAEVRAERERVETEVRAERAREEAERRERRLSRPAPPPAPQPYGVSHEGAEHLVCAWIRHLGVLDAEVTRLVGDGGIDVDSEHYVAQVKNLAGSVPVGEVRALLGSAVSEGKKPLLFTSGSLTVEGKAFAERVRMAVFRYDAVGGTIQGLNELGDVAVERGIPEAFA